MRTATKAIKAHTQYSADDYTYLAAIGWSDEEIVARWTEEAKDGKAPCLWETEGAKGKLRGVKRMAKRGR